MGQCHQILYIIAKPRGQNYRSLAGAHQSWLFDVSAPNTCHRLLKIFSDEANRSAIQQELTFASDFFGNASNVGKRSLGAAPRTLCPFPFITICLIVGASCDPDRGICFSVIEEPFGMRHDAEYNSNGNIVLPDVYSHLFDSHQAAGITILDITDLNDLRYCFVDFDGMDSLRDVPFYTPLNGWTYLRAYYDDSDDMVLGNKEAADRLEKYALVELASLADCWPHSKWNKTAGVTKTELPHARSNKKPVPSLSSLAQDKLFKVLLSGDGFPDLTLLDHPMLFRGFADDLQDYLVENAGILCKSPDALEIITKAFAGVTDFDFTPFQNRLSADDLVALVKSEAFRDIKTANLSGFDSAPEGVQTVVAIMEHLKLDSLYMLARPDRRTEDPFEMLQALLECSNQPLVRQRFVLGSAFSRGLQPPIGSTKTPAELDTWYWKTFPVVQLLYHGPEASGPRRRGSEPWNSDFYLGDAFLTPVRFVTGLLNVIKGRFQKPYRAEMAYRDLDVPLSFACAPSSLQKFENSTEISPIPAEAVTCAKGEYRSSRGVHSTFGIRDLRPEVWTAVLVHTVRSVRETSNQVPNETRFRVALVRTRDRPIPFRYTTMSPSKLEVVDLRGFLEITAPEHADGLEACLSELTAWAQTGEELVTSLTADEAAEELQAFVEKPGLPESEVD